MAEGTAQIVVDTYTGDGYEYDAETSASERTSLRSSITDYVYENGRRYHAYRDGEYWGSNDEKAMDAMDIEYVVRLLPMHT